MQQPTADDEQCTEHQEAKVPCQRRTDVIPNVVNVQEVMIDDALHHIEDAPTRQDQSEVERPTRGETPFAPCLEGGDRAGEDQAPRRHVEQAVSQGVGFKAGHGVRGMGPPGSVASDP